MKFLPMASMVIVSLGASVAHAQAPGAPSESVAATSTLPTPGTWSTEIRMGLPATFTNNGVVMGVADFQLGIGKRLSDRWYVGATGEWILGLDVGGSAASAGDSDASLLTSTLRVGGEGRYIFHQGQATLNVDCGPSFTVPRYDWIGFRGGAQSVSGADGGFAELAIGMEMKVNASFQYGMYLAAGLSFEPSDAYGTPSMPDVSGIARTVSAPADNSSFVTSPYVTLGWDLTFG